MATEKKTAKATETTKETKAKKTTAKKAAATKKTTAKKAAPKKAAEKKTTKAEPGSFMYGRGRRKSAVARVRVIKNGSGEFTVNGRPMKEYFSTYELQNIVISPLKTCGQETAVDLDVNVIGGGIRGQAEAVRLGTSRALTELNPTFRTTLKKMGFLSRDARVKERKKFGLKKARRSPQWSKR